MVTEAEFMGAVAQNTRLEQSGGGNALFNFRQTRLGSAAFKYITLKQREAEGLEPAGRAEQFKAQSIRNLTAEQQEGQNIKDVPDPQISTRERLGIPRRTPQQSRQQQAEIIALQRRGTSTGELVTKTKTVRPRTPSPTFGPQQLLKVKKEPLTPSLANLTGGLKALKEPPTVTITTGQGQLLGLGFVGPSAKLFSRGITPADLFIAGVARTKTKKEKTLDFGKEVLAGASRTIGKPIAGLTQLKRVEKGVITKERGFSPYDFLATTVKKKRGKIPTPAKIKKQPPLIPEKFLGTADEPKVGTPALQSPQIQSTLVAGSFLVGGAAISAIPGAGPLAVTLGTGLLAGERFLTGIRTKRGEPVGEGLVVLGAGKRLGRKPFTLTKPQKISQVTFGKGKPTSTVEAFLGKRGVKVTRQKPGQRVGEFKSKAFIGKAGTFGFRLQTQKIVKPKKTTVTIGERELLPLKPRETVKIKTPRKTKITDIQTGFFFEVTTKGKSLKSILPKQPSRKVIKPPTLIKEKKVGRTILLTKEPTISDKALTTQLSEFFGPEAVRPRTKTKQLQATKKDPFRGLKQQKALTETPFAKVREKAITQGRLGKQGRRISLVLGLGRVGKTRQRQRQRLATKELVRTKQRQKQVIDLDVLQRQGQRQRQVTDIDILQKQRQRQVQRQKLRTRERLLGFDTPFVPIVDLKLTTPFGGIKGFGTKRGSLFKIKRKYTPTVRAATFNIFGKAPKGAVITGLGTRPLKTKKGKRKQFITDLFFFS